MLPKLFKTFRKIRKFQNHLVDFNILPRVWGQKYHITGRKIPKMTLLKKTTCKNYVIEQSITETFQNFRNVSESFGSHNHSWKREIAFSDNMQCFWACLESLEQDINVWRRPSLCYQARILKTKHLDLRAYLKASGGFSSTQFPVVLRILSLNTINLRRNFRQVVLSSPRDFSNNTSHLKVFWSLNCVNITDSH